MRFEQLHLKKQLGNKVIQMHEKQFIGYEIVSYKGYEPDELKEVRRIANPQYRPMSWDTAYDLIFGAPQAPDFTKVLND